MGNVAGVMLLAALSAIPDARVKRYYDEGTVAFKVGKFEKALSAYTAAYELDPLPAFLFNMGQCHRKMGHWKDAIFFFYGYLRDRPSAKNREQVERLIAKAEAKLQAVAPPPPAAKAPERPIAVPASPPPVAPVAVAADVDPAPADRSHALAPPPPQNLIDGRYAVPGDGTVRDVQTGLTWEQAVDSGSYNWSDAKALCSDLRLAGGGWHLPGIDELKSLVQTDYAPAIDTAAFPDTPSDWFWSSSPLAGSPSGACFVYFFNGYTGSFDVSLTGRVRCVR